MKIISLKSEQHQNHLKKIHNSLLISESLTIIDRDYLAQLISPFIESKIMVFTDILPETALPPIFNVSYNVEKTLDDWRKLFLNVPGYDFCPACYLVDEESNELLIRNVIMVSEFSPTMTFNNQRDEGFELRLKDDGTAYFWAPTVDDIREYPELFNFKGTWKEAYILLVETLKKGWPMEEFPEELQQFLKK